MPREPRERRQPLLREAATGLRPGGRQCRSAAEPVKATPAAALRVARQLASRNRTRRLPPAVITGPQTFRGTQAGRHAVALPLVAAQLPCGG